MNIHGNLTLSGAALERIEALATETLPILLLGDFNSPTADGTAYQMLLSAEYIDLGRWVPTAPATHVVKTSNSKTQPANLRADRPNPYRQYATTDRR